MGKVTKSLLFLSIVLALCWVFAPPFVSFYLFLAMCFCLSAVVFSVFSKKPVIQKPLGNSLVEAVVQRERKVNNQPRQNGGRLSLVETVVEKQLRMQKDRRFSHGKIQKRHFSCKQLNNIEETLAKVSKAKAPRKNEGESQEISIKISLTFKTLQELDYFLPSIEGTLNDFLRASDKFKNALAPFLEKEREKQLAEIIETRQYPALTGFLVECALRNKKDATVRALLKGIEFKRLQYGNCFIHEEKWAFRGNRYNVELYKEIACLLQEIFVRYSNENRKASYHSLDELLDKISLEDLENFHFEKGLDEFGSTVSDILVEKFLNSLKPLTRRFSNEYRSLRLLLRTLDIQESLKIGKVVLKIFQEIHKTYDMIQVQTAVKSRQEISRLIETTRVIPQFKQIPRDKTELSSAEAEEKQLQNVIVSVVKFLGWLPQDPALITEEEKNLVAYFNKLMYSRRMRLSVSHDGSREEADRYSARLARVVEKLKEAQASLHIITKQYSGNLIGAKVEILAPRQSEDYFPLEGKIEKIVREPMQNTHVVEFAIREENGLLSYVTFTGNNVAFN